MNRCKNFTEAEKKLLITLVEKYKSTIECKKTDAKSAKEKLQAWTELCEEFNSSSMYAKREVKQLQSSWKNIKTRAKADAAFVRRETQATGGGPPVKVKEDTELVQSKSFTVNNYKPC